MIGRLATATSLSTRGTSVGGETVEAVGIGVIVLSGDPLMIDELKEREIRLFFFFGLRANV